MENFDHLTLAQKLNIIRCRGRLLTSLTDKSNRIAFYRVGDMLVQQTFDPSQHTIKIDSVKYLNLVQYLPYMKVQSIVAILA